MYTIIYTVLPNDNIQVKLGKRVTGFIKKVTDGFAYFPKGSKICGDTFATIDQVKKDIEIE